MIPPALYIKPHRLYPVNRSGARIPFKRFSAASLRFVNSYLHRRVFARPKKKRQMEKVLIVKLGLSETLNVDSGSVVSLGDVLRTTTILHLFDSDDVTWLTSREAVPMLVGNPAIGRLIVFDLAATFQLKRERFDTIVNLEKVPGICAFVDEITARRKFGFRFDPSTGKARAWEHSHEALSISSIPELKKGVRKSWVEILYGMMGRRWEGQGYSIGHNPSPTGPATDIGFNNHVGEKWPTKAWPVGNWEKLAGLLPPELTISRQQCLDDLRGYMDWISSCRLIVSCDSLGAHLAAAFGRKAVVLYGPTSRFEMHDTPGFITIPPPDGVFSCVPCYQDECTAAENCMAAIAPEIVKDAVVRLLGETAR